MQFPPPLLYSSAVAQQTPVCQSQEQHAPLRVALNETPGAAQWLLHFHCFVAIGIRLSFLVCIFALPTPSPFRKPTERLDLQMNGQGSDNKREKGAGTEECRYNYCN